MHIELNKILFKLYIGQIINHFFEIRGNCHSTEINLFFFDFRFCFNSNNYEHVQFVIQCVISREKYVTFISLYHIGNKEFVLYCIVFDSFYYNCKMYNSTMSIMNCLSLVFTADALHSWLLLHSTNGKPGRVEALIDRV